MSQPSPYDGFVSVPAARPSELMKRTAHVGALLREWRAAKRLSQLDLSLNTGVSMRHLSYVETGKARPSRDMLLRFADALEMPLHERNTLLTAAGYVPEYPEIALTALESTGIRRAIDYILEQHEPYPAFLVDRHWDVLMANRGAQRIGAFVMGGRPSAHRNIIRQVFDPDDMRAAVANWEELARELIRHLHAAVAATPSDVVVRALLDEALSYPGVPSQWRTRDLDVPPSPLLTTVFRKDGRELHFLSTFTTFGFARDVNLERQHIECCFPIDEATAAFCRQLRDTSEPAGCNQQFFATSSSTQA
jgi:transcriptional regulator with XRE-family HTH domain